MSDIKNNSDSKDNRPIYVSPSVIRLDDVHRGIGACNPQGSGNIGNCSTGQSPTGNCNSPGNSADGANCSYWGATAAGTCANPGSSPGAA